MARLKLSPKMMMVLAWSAIYLTLAAIIGMEIGWGQRINLTLPIPRLKPAQSVDHPLQPEFVLTPIAQGFADTTARPVFSPTRRPPPPPPPPEPPKPMMQKGQFVLLGVLITKEKKVALLREVANGKAARVEEGKEIKGILLSKAEPEKVTLTQFGDSEELTLKIQVPPKPPAPAPAQQAAPQPGQAPPQAANSVAGALAVPAPSAAPPGAGDAYVNRRRSLRGLPPI